MKTFPGYSLFLTIVVLVGILTQSSFLTAQSSTPKNWYVRTDGGTRYSSNMTSGKCDGQGDMPYPGVGANQHCAFNDVRWLWQDGSFPNGSFPSYGWVIAGGDTVIIRGSIGSGVSWRVGWNNNSSAIDSSGLYYGLPGDRYNSGIPAPPSGTPSQHTRILGENYASCTSQSARTQLHGGWSVYTVLDLTGVSNVDVGCVDITDFSNCGKDTDTVGCTDGVSDFAKLGIELSNTSTHITLTAVLVHGLSSDGIYGATGDGFVGTAVAIVGNADSGWNADDGSGTTGVGSFLMQNFEISWNGCVEEYPIVDPLPYFSCTDGGSGGYGDGFGTATAASVAPGWQVHFDQGLVSYNTQDGLDALHINGLGSTMTVTRVLAFGNQGQQIKVGGAIPTLQNSVIVGNCEAMTTQAIPGTPSGFGSRLAQPCRASNTAVVVDISPGAPANIQGNTIYSAGVIGLEVEYATSDTGPTNTLALNDNIFMGFFNSGAASNATPIYSNSGLQMLHNPGSSWTNNATFGARSNWTCPASGETNAICGDPGLVDETYHPYGSSNMAPAANSSPVIGAGVAVPGLPVDFTGQSRSNPPTIGAYDSPATGSTSSSPPATAPANTPPPATGQPATQWTKVANEGDIVNVPAGTTVRFGFAPNWDPQVTFSNATTFTASNSFFGGDPYPNQPKEVDALGTGSGITTGASPAQQQWTKVANEGDIVNVPAGTTVRFGFAPNWDPQVTFANATTFTASNSFFGGDPYPNQAKEVDALGTGAGITTGATTVSQQWIKVANEGDIVNVPAGTTVRFGFAPNWDPPITFANATTFTASNSFFGGDPYPGQAKEVDALGTGAGITTGASTAPQQWTKVANEGNIVNVPAGTTVRFGFAPNWDPQVTFANATTFTASNSFFGGDPYPNQAKEVDALGTGAGITTGATTVSQQWIKVANEGDIVNVPAGTTVRFGFAPNWDPPITFANATTFTASNSFFGGDPYPGQAKEVDALGTGAGITTGASTAPQQWTKVANEGNIVNVPAGTTVRFGFAPNWDPPITFANATTFTASNSFFGGDPYPGQAKEVDALGTGAGITTGASTAPQQWTKVANEGNIVNVP